MDNLYLDTNIFIDTITNRTTSRVKSLADFQLFTSVLSVHISSYVLKLNMPNPKLEAITSSVKMVDFTQNILTQALAGPTPDLEDNIQLHSAVAAGCTHFLTSDQQLLKMGYFGAIQITGSIPSKE